MLELPVEEKKKKKKKRRKEGKLQDKREDEWKERVNDRTEAKLFTYVIHTVNCSVMVVMHTSAMPNCSQIVPQPS